MSENIRMCFYNLNCAVKLKSSTELPASFGDNPTVQQGSHLPKAITLSDIKQPTTISLSLLLYHCDVTIGTSSCVVAGLKETNSYKNESYWINL